MNRGLILKMKYANKTVDTREAKDRRMRAGDSDSGTSLPAPGAFAP